jgi:ribonuclease HI
MGLFAGGIWFGVWSIEVHERAGLGRFYCGASHGGDEDVCMAEKGAWKLFFDGSICSQGRSIGCFIKPPKGADYEVSMRWEFGCTNNQPEYESLLTGLEMLVEVEAKRVEAYGDSELVVQQMKGGSQCSSGELNEYRDKWLDLLRNFKEFNIDHLVRESNARANALAQQVSGYVIRWGRFGFLQRPATDAVLVIQGGNGEVVDGGHMDNRDWRRELVDYLFDLGSIGDRKIRQRALKYTIVDGILYCCTPDGLLLKCLGEEEANVAMSEVHDGMCGAQ